MNERETFCNRCNAPIPYDRLITIAYRDGYYCSVVCRDRALAAAPAHNPATEDR